ncbi:YbgC/FadM family acyl-CoA thioesterase [Halovulum dunhuangense]|uniref:YbgC/FadM family acyl-CoA thioesterase n=1 Tax=Halovulum dunhuangense TaxID=1505036 RepID=A0A849L565_9RHOB|nr:YbgC/FadM family acyl-CoA thioesterase [Halovulum dunhuangense]NNU81267.1 YbgC/FadM family acyl-CoA thioesterase [Halovulum dunhuangense]
MTHECRFRVYYEDTDMAGVMYYANHLKFMERGRSEAVAAAGIDQATLLAGQGLAFVVRRVEIDYHSPARFGEELRVLTRMLRIGGASIEMAQELRVRDRLVASARVTVACMTASGGIGRLSAEIRQALAGLGAGSA